MLLGKDLARLGAVAAVTALLSLGLASTAAAQRQAPVVIWGPAESADTAVVAFIDDAECETAAVAADGDGYTWSVQIDPGECGASGGSVVSFTTDGQEANQTVTWASALATRVELTVSDAADDTTPEPTQPTDPPLAAVTAPEQVPPEAETITTQLHPGWNMIGWVGPATPVADLFTAVPELTHVYAWDGEEQRYRQATRTTIGFGLGRLTRGQGLWLFVGGDRLVEWVRPVSDDNVLLSLSAGRNLVGWVGCGGMSIEQAIGRFGDALVYAWTWNAESQRYERYYPGPDQSGAVAELGHGDALWVELSGPVTLYCEP